MTTDVAPAKTREHEGNPEASHGGIPPWDRHRAWHVLSTRGGQKESQGPRARAPAAPARHSLTNSWRIDWHLPGAQHHGDATLSITETIPDSGRVFQSWTICACTLPALRDRLGPPQHESYATAGATRAIATAVLNQPGVYRYDSYPESSVLAGQERRKFIDSFGTLEQARRNFPQAGWDGEGSGYRDIAIPQTPPPWFDPAAAGERWSEDD